MVLMFTFYDGEGSTRDRVMELAFRIDYLPKQPQMTRYGRRLSPMIGNVSLTKPYSGLVIQGRCAISSQISACKTAS